MANVPFNYSKLKGRAREKGMTLEKIHEETGISISSLSDKWNGKRFFNQLEMLALKKLLDLESVDAYFFAE
jgi:transcriptional regulator with XRE-family HTH domain